MSPTTGPGRRWSRRRQVVRHDGDDSYLVVAADKGTATFSDIANAVAIENGFWLGDAFASGGSAGYDHKKMGITARGAWESVKQHFHELGLDTQTEDFTVVGVGDMSGDVFGNGMLLSASTSGWSPRSTTGTSSSTRTRRPRPRHAERRRLFDLPRSSWADYDTALISAGGGVWPRTVKSIPISEQMRAALGLAADVTLAGPDRADPRGAAGAGRPAVQRRRRDLRQGRRRDRTPRWATRPTTPSASTATSSACGSSARAATSGSPSSAGSSSPEPGGRINTDAIDNSAGVDTSDHEVNIKIALQTQQSSQARRVSRR